MIPGGMKQGIQINVKERFKPIVVRNERVNVSGTNDVDENKETNANKSSHA